MTHLDFYPVMFNLGLARVPLWWKSSSTEASYGPCLLQGQEQMKGIVVM